MRCRWACSNWRRAPASAADCAASSVPRCLGSAQRSASKGFFFGLGLEGSAIRGNEAQSITESGGGGNVTLGYGLSKHWALYADGSGAELKERPIR